VTIRRNNTTVGGPYNTSSLPGGFGGPTHADARALALCDMDLDGAIDLVTCSYTDGVFSIVRSRGKEPYITAFQPVSGAQGDTITITGHNFTAATQVRFGITAASWYQVVSDSVMRARVGPGSNGSVAVVHALGTGTRDGFTFKRPSGTLTGPAIVCHGSQAWMTVTGTNGLPPFRFGYRQATTGQLDYVITAPGSYSAQIPLYTSLPGSRTYYLVSVSDTAGVANTVVNHDTQLYTIRALPSVTANNLSGCEGVPLALSGSPTGGTWTVSNPYSGPTTAYAYTYTDALGCTNTSEYRVLTMHAPPNAGTSGTLTVCSNSAPVPLRNGLGGTPATTGTWAGPSSASTGNYAPATMVPGAYTYTVFGPYCPDATAVVTVTEPTATTWYADGDNDGLGDVTQTVLACIAPSGHVANATDACPALSGTVGDPCDDGDAATMADTIGADCVCAGDPAVVRVALRVFLGGCYDLPQGLMHDALRVQELLPHTTPYTALGYTYTRGADTAEVMPATFQVTGADAVVDWLHVELRIGVDSTVATAPALVQRDGDVVGLDGISPLTFPLEAGDHHVVVKHRNHLGVMTQAPLPLSDVSTPINLTDGSTSVHGVLGMHDLGTVRVLWPGNVQQDGVVKYTGEGNDRDRILLSIGGVVPTNTVSGYRVEDCNLDGQVRYTGEGNDRDVILRSIGGVVPTNTVTEQVP
jgi:hypothetical protein